MPNFKRAMQPNGTFFFTIVSANRCPVLTHPSVRTALKAAIQDVKEEFPFSIDALVLMPDHIHCILSLQRHTQNYSKIIGKIKAKTSRALDGIQKPIWQRRFWEHLIQNHEDWRRHMDYTHYNPVKHGYVERVIDWPYSTFHRWVDVGFYPGDWGGNPDIDGRFGE